MEKVKNEVVLGYLDWLKNFLGDHRTKRIREKRKKFVILIANASDEDLEAIVEAEIKLCIFPTNEDKKTKLRKWKEARRHHQEELKKELKNKRC